MSNEGILMKSEEEIDLMKANGHILAEIVLELQKLVVAGSSPLDVEEKALALCKKYKVNPSCVGYNGYPAATCVGINNQAVHCIPRNTVFKEGDIVTVDMVIDKDGFFVDHALTVGVGSIDKTAKRLISETKKARDIAIDELRSGSRVGDIGHTIQTHVARYGFDVLKMMVGHGIGRSMHEKPSIPCHGQKGTGPILKEGMVFTIEPMVTEGADQLVFSNDNWSTSLADGKRFSMFEHTVAIRKTGVEVLTI